MVWLLIGVEMVAVLQEQDLERFGEEVVGRPMGSAISNPIMDIRFAPCLIHMHILACLSKTCQHSVAHGDLKQSMPLKRDESNALPSYDSVDWASLDEWRIIVAMASRGWIAGFDISRFRTENAKLHFSFKHPNWHGTLCDFSINRAEDISYTPDALENWLREKIRDTAKFPENPFGVPS
jgi:hypothetical protein